MAITKAEIAPFDVRYRKVWIIVVCKCLHVEACAAHAEDSGCLVPRATVVLSVSVVNAVGVELMCHAFGVYDASIVCNECVILPQGLSSSSFCFLVCPLGVGFKPGFISSATVAFVLHPLIATQTPVVKRGCSGVSVERY